MQCGYVCTRRRFYQIALAEVNVSSALQHVTDLCTPASHSLRGLLFDSRSVDVLKVHSGSSEFFLLDTLRQDE